MNCVDITPFIDNLPFGKSTNEFTTPDASGSTSQATNIIEALEAVSARGGGRCCSVGGGGDGGGGGGVGICCRCGTAV